MTCLDDPNIRVINGLSIGDEEECDVVSCDCCGVDISFMKRFYTDVENNVCTECYEKDPENFPKYTECIEDLDFGSLRDWFIIAIEDYANYILCNLNMDSVYYNRFAYGVVDGYVRAGYWICEDRDL